MEKVTYRVVEDSINRLNWLYQQHQDDPESGLFCPEAVSMRHRLKASLVKVIFLTPADFGAKGEELLWRKVFYEVLACVKKRRQAGRLTQRVEALYRCHLLTALGFYQQLMARILLEYPIDRADVEPIDFAPAAVAEAEEQLRPEQLREPATVEWARAAVHRCLLHIGDLYRYLREYKGDVALALVQRYYGAAARFDPRIGLPYNQLGTLDLGSYYNLTAVYYYLRCLACEQPFEGSRRNLATILRKNQRRFDSLPPLPQPPASAAPDGGGGGGGGADRPAKPVKQFVVRFLHLVARLLQHPLYLHQAQQRGRQFRGQHFQQQDAELTAVCQSVLACLATCLQLPPAASSGAEAAGSLCVRASAVDPMRPHQLADSALMQAVLSALLCLDSLSAANSGLAHVCSAFCLGMFACVLQCTISRCRSALAMAAAAAANDDEAAGQLGEGAGPIAAGLGEDEDDDETVEEVDNDYDDNDYDRDEGAYDEAGGQRLEEEEAGGDFPGFSAASTRRRRKCRRRRRSRQLSGSASSSDASSDCQLAFGYGEEDDESRADSPAGDQDGNGEAEDEAESERDAAAAAPPPVPAAASSEGPFCFSYGIPSALLFQDNAAIGGSSADVGGPPHEADATPAALAALGASTADVESPELGLEAAAADDALSVAQLQLLARVRLLQTVKLLLDWMLCQPHLLTRFVQASCLPLWDRLAALLNLLPSPPGEDCGIISPEPEDRSPALPEDAHIRGLALFRPAQRHLDFRRQRAAAMGASATTRLDECRQRLAALRRFGFLAVQNDQLAFGYDSAARQFFGPTAVRQASRDGQMRNLAQMRLIDQVQRLETAVSRAGPALTASHAVASRQCLTEGLEQLQALVRSRRSVLVLPRSSIDYLDRLKRTSQAARRASRYLEVELQSGRALINSHEFPNLAACCRQLSPDTTVFLVCRGETPPPELPFPVRDLDDFVRQALSGPGQGGVA